MKFVLYVVQNILFLLRYVVQFYYFCTTGG